MYVRTWMLQIWALAWALVEFQLIWRPFRGEIVTGYSDFSFLAYGPTLAVSVLLEAPEQQHPILLPQNLYIGTYHPTELIPNYEAIFPMSFSSGSWTRTDGPESTPYEQSPLHYESFRRYSFITMLDGLSFCRIWLLWDVVTPSLRRAMASVFKHLFLKHDFKIFVRDMWLRGSRQRRPHRELLLSSQYFSSAPCMGGAPIRRSTMSLRPTAITGAMLSRFSEYTVRSPTVENHLISKGAYIFESHEIWLDNASFAAVAEIQAGLGNFAYNFPPAILSDLGLSVQVLADTAIAHGVASSDCLSRKSLTMLLKAHKCSPDCPTFVTTFKPKRRVIRKPAQYLPDNVPNVVSASALQPNSVSNAGPLVSTVLRDLITGVAGFPFSRNVKLCTADVSCYAPHTEKFNELSRKFESFHVRQYAPIPSDRTIAPVGSDSLPPDHMFAIVSFRSLMNSDLLAEDVRKLARKHNLPVQSSSSKEHLMNALESHNCSNCPNFVGLLEGAVKRHEYRESAPFPPKDIPDIKIINDVCNALTAEFVEETGCAVCGSLTLTKDTVSLNTIESKLHVLDPASYGVLGATRVERASSCEPIAEIKGPIYDETCKRVCNGCATSVNSCLMPKNALANGNWIGRVPQELKDLSFAEKLLVARARQNRCIVRVRLSGMPKLAANAISWLNPTAKIYDKLPPPREDLESVLAILFVGPSPPTKEELKRIPLLVRHKKVFEAIRWLTLNHCDYSDVEFSAEHMNQYTDGSPPVPVEWLKASADFKGDADASAVNETSADIGAETGPCEIAVQGLSAKEIMEYSSSQYKIKALEHLKTGKFMVVGHHEDPDSIYDNPQLYPKLFPWLFPYGLGGVGNLKCISGLADLPKPAVSIKDRVRDLLMYHDKRFQLDPSFALTAFNHQQIRDSTLGGFLLAKKSVFQSISDRLREIDVNVLESLARRMKTGYVQAKTRAEKLCLDVINDLDHVAYRVNGSLTSKKYQRNQIWSLIAFLGMPSWFITFAPKDTHHPLCIYFADTRKEFKPDILRGDDIRRALISNNPIASARFFHKLVDLFILHVLGWGSDHPGLFGKTEGFYGTVEQQGRLTLHLHLLLWITGAPSPQQIRDRLSDPDSKFQTELLKYLDDMHVGQPIDATKDEVQELIANKSAGYTVDPLQSLPIPADLPCEERCDSCSACRKNKSWRAYFKRVFNHILVVANLHDCNKSVACSEGFCKGRYPRACYPSSTVEPQTGHIYVKKTEPMINTVNPVLTYLMRCNTDVTSLRSGTAIKAVVGYVTDYTAKPALKAYSVADIIRSTLVKFGDDLGDKLENSRRVMTSGVNQLSAKLGIGSPMAGAYLLNLPDHVTSHNFIIFFWRRYVHHAENSSWPRNSDTPSTSKVDETADNSDPVGPKVDPKCKAEYLDPFDSCETSDTDESPDASSVHLEDDERVKIHRKNADQFVPYTSVYDYTHRPLAYNSMSLYEWICRVDKKKMSLSRINKLRASYKLSSCDVDEKTKRLLTEIFFTEGHPQRETHDVRILPASEFDVPDFIGGSVPRSDGGDREFYCRTMLTLFKAWRTGKDLRQQDETWHEAFTIQAFSPRQRDLMAYFNERYECNDARDEYRTNRNATITQNGPEFLTEELIGELDDVRKLEQDIYADMDDNTNVNWVEAMEENKRYYKRFADMKEVHRMLLESGWLDESADGIPSLKLDLTHRPNQMSPSRWKKLLAEERKARLKEKNANMPSSKNKNSTRKKSFDRLGVVKIVDKSYLTKSYSKLASDTKRHINSLVASANLNEEQERAFRIIVNHAASSDLEQLRMYLGGMGGTGKSRVLETVMQFFKDRNETHRFLVMAPTGSAAALINGSTFHSILGFGTGNSDAENETSRAKVKDRLQGVEYIFFDEVSMLSCSKLYKIAAKLSELNADPSVPFGGINMIFAGDFAQLPPVFEGPSKALYSTMLEPKGVPTNTSLAIAIGRSLWHQITTVVILRQNMRQTTQTPRDAAFRTALENMRYGACTYEDIKFLNSMVASKSGGMNLAQSKFRYVSVLVTTNTQRDKINALGCERFAKENHQPIMTFYADDSRKDSKGAINKELREHLWSLPHCFTDHKPGMLKLCKGMPILIKENIATECCVTNGAEAVVEDWLFHLNEDNKPVLDTLFVRLINPPRNIQLADLPVNIVPITPVTSTFTYTLPTGVSLNMKRSHIPVLPNFAMTDYSSQGRTRKANVVSLGGSFNSLLSTYTMLSRSASADDTVIIQGFDPVPLQRGTLGYIRQEFREMEILNHITELRYHKSLPEHIAGDRRSVLINLYRSHFGKNYVPKGVHPTLNWDTSKDWDTNDYAEPFTLDLKGRIRDKKETHIFETENKKHRWMKNKDPVHVPDENDAPSKLPKRQKKRKPEEPTDSSNKRPRTSDETVERRHLQEPVGFCWDSVDWSCAYDSFCFILLSTWNASSSRWKAIFSSQNHFCEILHRGFTQSQTPSDCVRTRDFLRDALFSEDPVNYPRTGPNEISVIKVISSIVKDTRVSRQRLSCSVCTSDDQNRFVQYPALIEHRLSAPKPATIQQWLDKTISEYTEKDCRSCGRVTQRITHNVAVQPLLVFNLGWSFYERLSPRIPRSVFHSAYGVQYNLCGIIYFGEHHFTACVISQDSSNIWYNDGASHGSRSVYVGNLGQVDVSGLYRHDGRRAIAVVYTSDGA